MRMERRLVAGMPHLDVCTVSEDWLLATSVGQTWEILADLMDRRPAQWIDAKGDRMYAAVVYARTSFDLAAPVREDDEITLVTAIEAVKKPHALSHSQVLVGGQLRASATCLSSFVKRQEKGSNKKFSRVRELWATEDFAAERIEELNERHHAHKDDGVRADFSQLYQVNRIVDFNQADFMYFKNYVRIAKAAEWRAQTGGETRLNAERECFFYGNVADGEVLTTQVEIEGDKVRAEHRTGDGKRIFLSAATMAAVHIELQ